MVTQMGMSDLLGNVDLNTDYNMLSSDTKALIEHEVRRLVEEGHKRAMKMLTERRGELDIIAKALVEYEVLDLEEMQKVLRGEKLQKLGSLAGVPMTLPGIGVGLPGLSGPGTGAAGTGVSAGTAVGTGTAGGKGEGGEGRGGGPGRMAGRGCD